MSLKRRGGFTLVELLVVIGIIALLISILLPSLTRARQQANLVYCQANLRQIGQLIELYATQNNGYMPPSGGWFETPGLIAVSPGQNGQYIGAFTWSELLTLMINPLDIGATVPASAGGPFANHPADTAGIFHDVDTPPAARQTIGTTWLVGVDPAHGGNTCDYIANPRCFSWINKAWFQWGGDDTALAPYPYAGNPANQIGVQVNKPKSSFRRAAEVADVWDGPVFLDPVTGYLDGAGTLGGGNIVATSVDNMAFYGGYSASYPVPLQFNSSGATTNPPINGEDTANGGWGYGLGTQYENPIAIGQNSASSTASSWGGMTLTLAKWMNHDQTTTGFTSDFDGPSNQMRFRHLGNTTANLLFMDGHVESRPLQGVFSKDYSDNIVR